MQIIVILILFNVNQFAHSQDIPKVEKGSFKVTKIDDTFSDFYLIFVEKGDEKYTISSPKTIIIKGQKLEVGKEYYLELQRNNNLPAEFDLISNDPNIYFYDGKYKGSQLGILCVANNLIGLIIPEQDTNNSITNEKNN